MPFTASDVGNYSYCPVSWLLAKNQQGDARHRGIQHHAEAANRVRQAVAATKAMFLNVCYAIVCFLLMQIPYALVYDRHFAPSRLAPLWLTLFYGVAALSLFFLYRAWKHYREAQALDPEKTVGFGKLLYADMALASTQYGLIGKPDFVVEREGQPTPVEFKSARTPAVPYDSHRMQIASYCLLVEDLYGKRPSMGIIRYTDGTHEVPYTEDLRKELLDTLARMTADEARGAASRNHDNPRKCGACAQKAGCSARIA